METRAKLLGQYIKKQRKKCHMTMATLSSLCDLSISHISRIEKGVDASGKAISPSLEVIQRIATALNISINHLLVDSKYITVQKETEKSPMYDVVHQFLKNENIIEQYGLDIDMLDNQELEDAYRILLDAIDLVALKYTKDN